jgi:hypothetical protein
MLLTSEGQAAFRLVESCPAMNRRLLALALVVWGLGALLLDALRTRPSAVVWLGLWRKFRGANAATRLLNSPLFARDQAFGLAVLRADRTVPLACDAALEVDPSLPEDGREDAHRRAGYVLAPRRVVLTPGKAGGRFVLHALPGPGCDPTVLFRE